MMWKNGHAYAKKITSNNCNAPPPFAQTFLHIGGGGRAVRKGECSSGEWLWRDKIWNAKITCWASRARVMAKGPSGAWTPAHRTISSHKVTWQKVSPVYCLSLFLHRKVCWELEQSRAGTSKPIGSTSDPRSSWFTSSSLTPIHLVSLLKLLAKIKWKFTSVLLSTHSMLKNLAV